MPGFSVPRNIIVGSGPAAAAAALALSSRPDQEVLVVDIGGRLESAPQSALARLGSISHLDWDPADLNLVATQPVLSSGRSLPQKRTYGSAYPFYDRGQLSSISHEHGANGDVVSSAYGGFSNVWGAQAMPFSRSTFDSWPISWSDMEGHYRSVLEEVPLAGEIDDLVDNFPLLNVRHALPPLGPRTRDVLNRYGRHRPAIRQLGVVIGRARLAFAAGSCVLCGHCMTGCPYSLIYSAAQTFDRLRAMRRVDYHDGLLVTHVAETADQVQVQARDLATDRTVRLDGDRLFLACGGLGTTRIVVGSLPTTPTSLTMAESMQFVVPFLSTRAVPEATASGSFTLNQFNILLDFDGRGYTTSQIHCYPYNPAFDDALPGFLRRPALAGVADHLLRRTTAGLGYLPSWESPAIQVDHHRVDGQLPALRLRSTTAAAPTLLRRVLLRLTRAAPKLDLWPVLPLVSRSGAAKSYHFGSSFPHARHADHRHSDLLGRPAGWRRIHLIDGSVLPSVPSTTFTLTVMANAHRIATAASRIGES